MVSFDKALELVLNGINSSCKVEDVEYFQLLNRVVANDIYAVKNLPSFNNSAMDGYAFRHSDINKPLKVAKTIYAGDIIEPILGENECYKIMTGAKVPSDADTIAPKELCEVQESIVTVQKELPKHNALRFAGEEVKQGEVIVKKGEILNAPKIALLASQGITSCQVYKKLSIAIVSTGDELKEPWEKASVNQVYNINAINLQMHLKEYGFDGKYLGKIPDSFEQTLDFISNLKQYDVVISSGGISKGDKDYILKALQTQGFQEFFSGINVKPGHPTTIGKIQNTLFIALPGNPLATILNFILLGTKAIFKKQGATNFDFKKCTAQNTQKLNLRPTRVNIVLGKTQNGKFTPYKNNKYGSGMITPLVESNSIAIFNEGVEAVQEGEEIEVILLEQ